MKDTKFYANKREYVVWDEFEKDSSGDTVWLCREYYGDGSLYATTAEISKYREADRAQAPWWRLTIFSGDDEAW